MKKILSAVVSLCFINLIITDIYGAFIPKAVPVAVNNTADYNLLPEDIGKFVQDMYVLGDKTIINIQDLHSDENTQKNIISILEFLSDNYNIKNVYLEGAYGNLDFGWLNVIKDEKLKKTVADNLLKEGKITGTEYFGLFEQNKNIFFKGLEEEQVYKDNFYILEQMFEKRAEINIKMQNVSNVLEQAAEDTYNFRLKAFNDLVTDYNTKNVPRSEYYEYLLKLIPKSVSESDYKNIVDFLKLEQNFKSIDTNKLKSEISEITTLLKENLPFEQYTKIQKTAKAFPDKYCNELLNFVLTNKLENNYSELIKFSKCLKKRNMLDATKILNEEKFLTDRLYDEYSKATIEKNLIFLNSYTEKLLLFLTNNIPSFEYEYIKENFGRYCILLKNYISNTDITEIKQWYKLVNEFYSNNEKRNLFFLENILNKKISEKDFVNKLVVKNEGRKSFEEILQKTKQPIDIMVTGGYHSLGLQDLMTKSNINYAVIMPNVQFADIETSEDKFYKDYIKQYSILSNTYQKFIRSSVMNMEWKDPVKVIIGTFLDYTVLQSLSSNLNNEQEFNSVINFIQQHFKDILQTKGLKSDINITNIESAEKNSFIVTVSDNDKERMFYVSQNVAGEIHDKSDISTMQRDIETLNRLTKEKKQSEIKRILKKLSRFITFILAFPLLMAMGGGGGGFRSSGKQPQPKVKTINGTFEYVDTVVEDGAQAILEGKIKLDNVFVNKGTTLTLKAGTNTFITMKNMDLSEIGDLDITIEDNGDYEIVSEEGIVKVYKVLKTDFSSSTKQKRELVSVLKKGSLFLPNESDWETKETDPVVVFHGRYGSWSSMEDINKRSELIYKGKKVIYIDVSDITSMRGEIEKERLIRILEQNNLQDKNVCLDLSLIEERFSKPLATLGDIWSQQTNGATFLNSNIPFSLFVKSSHSFNRNNTHFYLNSDGTYKRYPYKDRNWLKSVLQKYMPAFTEKTFVFVWPVESVKYTYFTPKYSDGGAPEQRILAFEPFKQFMDKAKEYTADGKNSIVFMPGYLISELSLYLGDKNIGDKFVDITYGDSEETNPFSIWYKKQDAKQIEKIEVLKLDGLTIVMYPEGNRGHNEQAYLKTLMATYNFGKESFDSMLTQAGFAWKANTVYVYEGKEMENLDMEAQLLKNPSIKTGKVSYVYDNLKRVFIDLYSNMNRFFRTIIPKYMKGNWISFESEVRETIDMTQIKEAVSAKSKLGFESTVVIPVNANVLNETEYGEPEILEQDGKEIRLYTLEFEGSKIYLVGIDNPNTAWQDSVLNYISDFLRDYRNNIVSFEGVPQLTSLRLNYILSDNLVNYIPVVLTSDEETYEQIESLGYDDIVDTSEIISRIGNTQLKYPHVASDMKEISEAITVIKALKRKSFFGNFSDYKTSYVGVKIASDEHIFNSEMEENEFIEILKGTDIDFVTVVIRDNDLGVHVLNRTTTVKENLTKLSENLHKNNKKIVLEYTFRFVDEFFNSFVRSIQEDCTDMDLDGIKLDLADCPIEDIGKTIKDFKAIREALPDLSISIQVSNEAWEKHSPFFEELNITRTVSSKEELLLGEHDLSDSVDVNYEISIYKNQQEYEQKLFSLTNQRERLLDKDPERLSPQMKALVDLGEEKFADQIIDNRLENIFQKVVVNDSIGKLILPVNMLYAKRLENNENSNVIQAVSNLIRLFKESKGMGERRKFAYEYGLQQKVNLTSEEEQEIAKILRGESKESAGSYVRKHYPFVFNYFVESRQTRIEISDSFLFGIYEANIIRKYKEGQFGKVLEFALDKNLIYNDTQEAVDKRQALFYRALAHISLYRNVTNIEDLFSIDDDDYDFYEGKNYKENYLNALIREVKGRDRMSHVMMVFEKGFPLLTNIAVGYLPNRESTLYEARILLRTLSMVYTMQEIEPVLPELTEEELQVDDMFINENSSTYINELLASA